MKKLLDLAYDKVESQFDMIHLSRALSTIEKLLAILFSEDQRFLFDLIPDVDFRPFRAPQVDTGHAEKLAQLQRAQDVLHQIEDTTTRSQVDINLHRSLEFLTSVKLS